MSGNDTVVNIRNNDSGAENTLVARVNAFFSGDERLPVRTFWVLFGLVALIGTAFRFSNAFTNSLWMDEAVTAGISRMPLDVIMFNNVDYHPPLSFVVQHIWMKLVPDPQFFRAPVAFAGAISVVLFMLAAKDLISRSVAIFGGLFFALSTGHIYYSQDLRMYIFVALGVVLAVWGVLGVTDDQRTRKLPYQVLYVLGGAIAIYSQAIGLISMAFVGMCGLAGALIAKRGSLSDMIEAGKPWLFANLALLILAIPGLIALVSTTVTHGGLGLPMPVTELPWHFRLMVGYPGLEPLGKVRDLAELAALGVAVSGGVLAWLKGRYSLALVILGLVVFYPIMIGIIHVQKQIIHVRMFVPCSVGMALGLGYAISSITNVYLRRGGLAAFASLALASTSFEQLHHFSIENYGEAFKYLDSVGYGDAPVVSCYDFSAAALWEARNDAYIIVGEDEGAFRYPGPEYWSMLGKSIVEFHKMDVRARGQFVNEADFFEGGLEEALAGYNQIAVPHSGCYFRDQSTTLSDQLTALGFKEVEQTLVLGRATPYPIIVGPGTHVHLLER